MLVTRGKGLFKRPALAEAGSPFGKGGEGDFQFHWSSAYPDGLGEDELTLHHLEPDIKFMVTRHATNAVGLDHGLIISNAHPATIRTPVKRLVFGIFKPPAS